MGQGKFAGQSRPTSPAFYDELASVLELLVVFSCPVVIGGDMNIHVHDANDADARRLRDPVSYTHLTLPTIYSV